MPRKYIKVPPKPAAHPQAPSEAQQQIREEVEHALAEARTAWAREQPQPVAPAAEEGPVLVEFAGPDLGKAYVLPGTRQEDIPPGSYVMQHVGGPNGIQQMTKKAWRYDDLKHFKLYEVTCSDRDLQIVIWQGLRYFLPFQHTVKVPEPIYQTYQTAVAARRKAEEATQKLFAHKPYTGGGDEGPEAWSGTYLPGAGGLRD